MPAFSSTGKCNLCGQAFSRTGIGRHLKQCGDSRKSGVKLAFHIVVEGRYSKQYWLHAALPCASGLWELDRFLRAIWLECCGHLSAFTINGRHYADSEFSDADMDIRADRVLASGAAFRYKYDFGSTTELVLKVAGIRHAGPENDVQLLARNDPPQIFCDNCGGTKAATRVCAGCSYGKEGWLCEDCAKSHECGSEMLLPVVNSPRTGVCGYSGR